MISALILEAREVCSQNASVIKTIHSVLSDVFCEHVKELRDKADMTQRALASALDREHGMVARIELGERRVDLIEAYQLFAALGADPAEEAASLMRKFAKAIKSMKSKQ